MWQYMIRRFLQMIPTLIGISIIIFFISVLIPGDFVDSNKNPNLSIERAAQLRSLYGLDQPLHIRYFTWAGNMIQGNLGDSLQHKMPVTKVIKTYIWNSFIISLASLVISWTVALIVGTISAIKQYSLIDKTTTFFVFTAMSLPSFFLGLLLIKLFAVDLGYFPIGGMTTAGASGATGMSYFKDVVNHMVLPVTVLVMINAGQLTRFFRTSMLDVIRQDYIRTARAKGLKESKVIFKHALRNALLPAITLLGFEIPGLFAGSIITESIFIWPGIGKVYLASINIRDYPLMLGFTMFSAVLTLIGTYISDILYGMADPRIRLK
ncbi:ABC transporter permease [Paenibacillus sp. N1-5-1-14]|uniref:ABC transporter permease n=1 Tax=Paenibacillus radicibacter TaxID=2972488 RepID=UPI002159B448|nr:ABC transporter permease [Paenibacillus radicibacter]MCR8641609.1 ABC transporter permease [Paenibacillus radicibacter]